MIRLAIRESRIVEDQRPCDHVVERLLLGRETRHEVPDSERDQTGDYLRKESPGGVCKGQPLSLQIGYAQRHCQFAESGLPRRALHQREVEPAHEQKEQARDKERHEKLSK